MALQLGAAALRPWDGNWEAVGLCTQRPSNAPLHTLVIQQRLSLFQFKSLLLGDNAGA